MNGYERINAALHGIMPDKRPVMLHGFMLAAKEAGVSMKQYRESPEKAAECHIRFTEKYDIDGILFDVDVALLASSIGVPTVYPEDEPAMVTTTFLNSLDEIDKLEDIDISKNIRIQHSLEVMKILRKHYGKEKFLRGNCDQAPFSLACCMRSPANFMMDLMLDPENAKRLIEYTKKVTAQFIRLMAGVGVDMVSNGDSPAGPSMISPEMYKEFAFESEKFIVDTAHECNVPYLLHICGNTDVILNHMAELNLDAVELDYLTSIDKIYDNFKDKATLFGTIDPSGVIAFGSTDDVRREVLALKKLYKNNPHLVINAGCGIPPITPEANIRALIEAAREIE